MKNILYSDSGLNLPKEVQMQRIHRFLMEELTEVERKTLTAYYFEGLRKAEIARRQGVHRSTVHRTLQRAEARLRRFLKY